MKTFKMCQIKHLHKSFSLLKIETIRYILFVNKILHRVTTLKLDFLGIYIFID